MAFRFVLRGTHLGTFAGIPATGKKMTLTGMDFIRITHGKLIELWSNQDTLGWLQQLGLELKVASLIFHNNKMMYNPSKITYARYLNTLCTP